jgi:tetratricopeptide (TPR) repeat protein
MEELLATPEGVAARAANLERARETFERILEDDPAYWPAYRGLGDVHAAEGNDREAARAWLTYAREVPDAIDRALVVNRLTAIRDQLVTEDKNDG